MAQGNGAHIILQDEDVRDTFRSTPSNATSTGVLAKNTTGEKKKPKRKFTREQLRAGQTFLTQQAATNQYASQKRMTSFGAVRHVSDIKVTELYDEEYDDEEM